jgi:hypothetical protein
MLKRVTLFSLLAAILLNGCAASPPSAARSDFAEMCQALGITNGKISKEEFVAGAKDKQEAEKLFDMCEKNRQGYLTVEEAERQNWAIREMFKLTPPPVLTPPRGGRK